MATVDDAGLPVTAAIDMMDYDEGGLYFLTAKGKGFYDRLKKRETLALTGMKGTDTMHCAALSIQGKVRELGGELLPRLFEKNPYMNDIYPDAASRSALTVFLIYEGSGEWFDLSKKPIERQSFVFGGAINEKNGKPAITHYKVLERFGNYTYMQFKLETGRTHQIRVHMASIGHPLLGDALYSSGRSPFKHLQGQCLHKPLVLFIPVPENIWNIQLHCRNILKNCFIY